MTTTEQIIQNPYKLYREIDAELLKLARFNSITDLHKVLVDVRERAAFAEIAAKREAQEIKAAHMPKVCLTEKLR